MKPEKMIQGLSSNPIAEEGIRMYNQSADEFKAYYESDAYIQSLIDDGRIVIDEDILTQIIFDYVPDFSKNSDWKHSFKCPCGDCYLVRCSQLKQMITQSTPLRVKSKEGN